MIILADYHYAVKLLASCHSISLLLFENCSWCNGLFILNVFLHWMKLRCGYLKQAKSKTFKRLGYHDHWTALVGSFCAVCQYWAQAIEYPHNSPSIQTVTQLNERSFEMEPHSSWCQLFSAQITRCKNIRDISCLVPTLQIYSNIVFLHFKCIWIIYLKNVMEGQCDMATTNKSTKAIIYLRNFNKFKSLFFFQSELI